MATLKNAIPTRNTATAVLIPSASLTRSSSYDDLYSHTAHLQRRLAEIGIDPQSAVSIALPNSYEFIVSFLATTWQRAVAAPLNPAYRQDEFEFYLDDLKSKLLVLPPETIKADGAAVRAARKLKVAIAECCWGSKGVTLNIILWGSLARQCRPKIHQPLPDDIALVLHTSGTTGRPKVVPLTHRNLCRSMRNITETYRLSNADRTLLVMPLFHVHGLLAGLLASLSSSGSVIVPTRFSAREFWQLFISHKANWYTAVPTSHQILLRSPLPNPIPKIRFIRSCSSPLAPAVFHKLEETFKAPVLEAYAMTEAAHQMTSNPFPPSPRFPGSVGLGQGLEVEVLDPNGQVVRQGQEGEICIRGENVTLGYLNNSEANRTSFTSHGFFRTGDQGKKDDRGYLIITGRIKELINKGGEKISPVEIDNVITQHPQVSEAVCFAMPDELYGQNVGVAVVLSKGNKLSAESLTSWIAERVAKFKVPKEIYFTDIMPKTPTGKVQRRMVAEQMAKTPKESKL